MQSFKDFGAGPKSVEDIVYSELLPLTEAFEHHVDLPFDCKDVVSYAVSNIICTVVFGER